MKPVIKKILIGTLATLVLLVGTLVVHIAMVTKKPVYDNAFIQMSRIDLEAPIDSNNRAIFANNAKQIEAINRYVVNEKNNNILITYDVREIKAQDLHQKISNGMTIESNLYVPSAESLENSCPILDKESFSYKLGSWIEKML